MQFTLQYVELEGGFFIAGAARALKLDYSTQGAVYSDFQVFN